MCMINPFRSIVLYSLPPPEAFTAKCHHTSLEHPIKVITVIARKVTWKARKKLCEIISWTTTAHAII